MVKTNGELLRFAFGNRQGLDSTMGTAIPIWGQWNFKPALVMLISGKTELISDMDIVRKLDTPVRFAGDQIQVWVARVGNDDL